MHPEVSMKSCTASCVCLVCLRSPEDGYTEDSTGAYALLVPYFEGGAYQYFGASV